MGVRNWRRKSQDREQWRTILEEAKVLQVCNIRRRRRRRRRKEKEEFRSD